MMEPEITHLKDELTQAGFRPAPFSALVHGVRRIIWPFIRQYHFYQLEKLSQVESQITASQIERLNQVEGRINHALDQLRGAAAELERRIGAVTAQSEDLRREVTGKIEGLGGDTGRLTLSFVEVRSDVAALVNRQCQLTEDVARLGDAQSEAGKLAVLSADAAKKLQKDIDQLFAGQIELLERASQTEAVVKEIPQLDLKQQEKLAADLLRLKEDLLKFATIQDKLQTEIATLSSTQRDTGEQVEQLQSAHDNLHSQVELQGEQTVKRLRAQDDKLSTELSALAGGQTHLADEVGRFITAQAELRGTVNTVARTQGETTEELTRLKRSQSNQQDVLQDIDGRASAALRQAQQLGHEVDSRATRLARQVEELREEFLRRNEQTSQRADQAMQRADAHNNETGERLASLIRQVVQVREDFDLRVNGLAQQGSALRLELETRDTKLTSRSESLRTEFEERVSFLTSNSERKYGAVESRLDTLSRQAEQVHGAIENRVESLTRQTEQVRLEFDERMNSLIQHSTLLRQDLDARTNIFFGQNEQFRNELSGLSNRQSQLGEEQHRLVAGQGDLQNLVQGLAGRHKLFLANLDLGMFLLQSGELISEFAAANGCWDPHLLPVIASVCAKRNGLAVDVGAHFGLLSAAMGRQFKRVVSFEPNGFNYHVLVANMAMNGLSNVECINGALYSSATPLSLGKVEDQEVAFSLKENGEFDGLAATNLGAFLFTENGSGLFPTNARTLDSYGLEDVALIKIDAQGADGEVLAGARETLARCRPVVIFEWEKLLSHKFRVSLDDVMAQFEELGYRTEALKVTNEKQADYIAFPKDQTSPTKTSGGGRRRS